MRAANSDAKIAAIRQQVQESYAQLCALVDGPISTLAAAKLYHTPEEGEWSIMQSLAHIQEFLPYWAGEVEKLVACPGQNFGRTMQDEGRLQALRVHGQDPLPRLKEALPGSYARLDDVLSRLQEDDLELSAQHVRYGERTLEWFIDEFITAHLHNHVLQLRACLAALA
jgi:hypothetical protein